MKESPFDVDCNIDINPKNSKKWSDLALKTDQNGLVPAIIQDAQTQKVLMLGYLNAESWAMTLETGKVTFFSRSKQRLWTKGESTGNFLHLQSAALDCDRDTLLLWVIPDGPTCHTGKVTCWGEQSTSKGFLHVLEQQIQERKSNPKEGSYTNHLLEKGIAKIAQKVGEEAVETVIEAMQDKDDLFKNEVSDLLYHLLVLLAAKGTSLREIEDILAARQQ
jgi:phosphoribosyl-AMP cyclohydrolase / phosphoribosyl-ATP pyrophosphohydrolase